MHCGIKPALNHPYRLIPFLLIRPSDSRKKQEVRVIEKPRAKIE